MPKQRKHLTWTRCSLIAAFCLLACGSPDDPKQPEAAWTPAPAPPSGLNKDTVVTDESGTIHYIVELRNDSANGFAKDAPDDGRFPAFHKPEVRNLIYAFEELYGIQATSMTSLTGIRFAAFLTSENIEKIRYDKRVLRITPDYWMSFSADATSVWTDQKPSPDEVASWGKQAVHQGTEASNGKIRVYVIDGGVGYHPDLNVVQRINAYKVDDEKPGHLVCCYPHATHVAGIIGAMADGDGTQGINPGAEIVSVSTLNPDYNNGETYDATHHCLKPQADIKVPGEGVILALEWVKSDIIARNQMGIVNISINADIVDNEYRATGSVGATMSNVANDLSIAGYPGAFIAQSAGNFYKDACDHAYGPPAADDGIMVVGAINDHGQPVVPLNGMMGFRSGPIASSGRGSNYGSCVDVWAPGSAIYSTWANDPQSAIAPVNTYAYLSGTSMAAPHIAGLASYLAETQGPMKPALLEKMVRDARYSLGSCHPSCLKSEPNCLKDINSCPEAHTIRLASLNKLPDDVPHSTPYAEIALSNNKDNFIPSGPPDYMPQLSVFAKFILVNGTLASSTDKPFAMTLDSIGTGPYACDIIRTQTDPPGISEQLGQAQQNFWPSLSWGSGTWTVSSGACPSAHATIIQFANDATKGAQFIEQMVPSTVIVGKPFTVSLTFMNTGDLPWSNDMDDTQVHLESLVPADIWDSSPMPLASGELILKGQKKTFTFKLEAPTSPSTHSFQWQMIDYQSMWFGDPSPLISIEVKAPPPPGTGPCAFAPAGQPCKFDTRSMVNHPTKGFVEFITAYGRYWEFDINGAALPGSGSEVTTIAWHADGPCALAPVGSACTFDTRTLVDYPGFGFSESITAYGRYFNFDVSGMPFPNNGDSLFSVPRYASGPCAFAPQGQPCEFDTRALGDYPNIAFGESITAYGRYFNYDINGNSFPDSGASLSSVSRYAIGPCSFTPAGQDCFFETRFFVIHPIKGFVEYITAYGRSWEFDINGNPLPGNGSDLKSIPHYIQ